MEQPKAGITDKGTGEVLNFSAASTYLKCPKQFEFRYVLGLKIPPKIFMIEGSAHHKALEKNNLSKKGTGRDLKPSRLVDYFMGDFRGRIKETGKSLEWEGEKEDGIFQRAKALLSEYCLRVAPKIKPEAVEEKFQLPVENGDASFQLNGVIDLVEKGPVWDYKVTSKAKTDGMVKNSLQLSLYALAAGKSRAGFIQFLKKATPEVGMISAVKSKEDKQWALKVAIDVVKAVKAKVFPRTNPENWWCSEKHCGYWYLCRGKVTNEKINRR